MSPSYIDKKVSKSAMNIEVQVKSNIFDPTDSISILLFLKQLKGFCDTKRISEGIATWLIPYLMKRSASLTL